MTKMRMAWCLWPPPVIVAFGAICAGGARCDWHAGLCYRNANIDDADARSAKLR